MPESDDTSTPADGALPTNLRGVNPDELLMRGMQSARMTGGGAHGWEPPTPEDVARLFPGYEILSMLGHGGMGAVYKARQTELDRLVAIKLLPLEISVDKDFADRFRREARAMAKLNHPNIITVYDFGQTREGHLFFAMEFVEGANLQAIIHTTGLEPDQALALATQVCAALAYAHGKGVVHRDIKPANVMVDLEFHAKVADFGLARLTDPSAESFGTTATGLVMGTPDYMAPEQKRGMNVDHRADIYSLGVMLYEMLCRKIPQGYFTPPSQVTGCDPRVDHIVIRAMQQEPEQRYQTTQAMKADVDTARTPIPKPAPISPVPAAIAPVAAKKPRRRLWLTSSFIAAFVLFVGGVLVTEFLRQRSRSPMAFAPSPAPSIPPVAVVTPVLPPGAVSPATATKDARFVNSLGMKFVPVPIIGGPTDGQRVLFSVWETRVQDYELFVQETRREWPKPDFQQGPTHPAVNVSWDDAQAFCTWLSQKEGRTYRLPSDHEWSCAAGIGDREDATKLPQEKNRQIGDIFPWGNAWPPPAGAGNFSGEEVRGHFTGEGQEVLKEYRDNFPATAPVGSFEPSPLGLFDLAGNAWEWCEDRLSPEVATRVVRGGCFHNFARESFLTSLRGMLPSGVHHNDKGFRVVLSVEGKTPFATDSPSISAAATKDTPFVNSLGMKFAPVPITGGPTDKQRVLFSVWETRVQDYEAFVKETKREWPKPAFKQGPTHPAVNVTWADAVAFCAWLTERDHNVGRIEETWRYRLPQDHEWSCAVGLGELEDASKTPEEKDKKNDGVFPWGTTWPPPAGAGNYSGEEAAGIGEAANDLVKEHHILTGYRDAFPFTAPGGSFASNRCGLFDLGGNAWEWCADPFKPGDERRVLRGSSFVYADRSEMLSSVRGPKDPAQRNSNCGFRCVLAPATSTLPAAK